MIHWALVCNHNKATMFDRILRCEAVGDPTLFCESTARPGLLMMPQHSHHSRSRRPDWEFTFFSVPWGMVMSGWGWWWWGEHWSFFCFRFQMQTKGRAAGKATAAQFDDYCIPDRSTPPSITAHTHTCGTLNAQTKAHSSSESSRLSFNASLHPSIYI